MTIWPVLTRLGEAEILLPVAVFTALLLYLQHGTRRLALLWMGLLFVAASLTTLSKLAFIGWGLGWAAIDYTGISGHAMLSSAVYPLLLRTYAGGAVGSRRRMALLLGAAVALVVGVSRLAIGVHSVSEVLAGWALGAAVTVAVLRFTEGANARVHPLLPVAMAAWVAVMPLHLQASQTHSLVTGLALKLSGRVLPYTRSDLMQGARNQGQP